MAETSRSRPSAVLFRSPWAASTGYNTHSITARATADQMRDSLNDQTAPAFTQSHSPARARKAGRSRSICSNGRRPGGEYLHVGDKVVLRDMADRSPDVGGANSLAKEEIELGTAEHVRRSFVRVVEPGVVGCVED